MALPRGANPAISRKGSVGEPGPAGAPGRETADCVRSSFAEFRDAELGEGFAPPWTPAGQRATARYSPRTHRHLVPRWGSGAFALTRGSSSDEWLDLQVAVAGERLEVSVIVQDRCTLTDRDGRDQAVDESPNRLALPSTGAVQVGGLLEVGQAPQSQQGKWERSEEHTSELQSRGHLVCRLLLEKKKHKVPSDHHYHNVLVDMQVHNLDIQSPILPL